MEASTADRLAFLRRLRAVKEYTPEPIPDPVVEEILEVGRWSASGANRQPWQVLVVRDPEVKQRLGEWGARPAATAAVVLLIVMANDTPSLDEGRLAERLCLAAAAQGLGSTVATLKNEGPDAVKTLLGIPAERRAVALVAIGHTDREARRARPKNPQPRKPMSEFARWDRF
ncbi:MAG TPA: nitroreductase family protein [Chloroflexota bacterium]|jgi:nitroreductase